MCFFGCSNLQLPRKIKFAMILIDLIVYFGKKVNLYEYSWIICIQWDQRWIPFNLIGFPFNPCSKKTQNLFWVVYIPNKSFVFLTMFMNDVNECKYTVRNGSQWINAIQLDEINFNVYNLNNKSNKFIG